MSFVDVLVVNAGVGETFFLELFAKAGRFLLQDNLCTKRSANPFDLPVHQTHRMPCLRHKQQLKQPRHTCNDHDEPLRPPPAKIHRNIAHHYGRKAW